jgi:hypothetical protein
MTKLKVTEKTEGKKTAENLLSYVFFILLSPFKILYSIFTLLGLSKNYTDITDSNWESSYWYSVNGQPIERKIIAEIGFDGFIKFYNLRTTDNAINELIKNKIFGEFIYETDYGLFLRQFDSPSQWPTSYLVFIDKADKTISKIKKVKSSWTVWKTELINDRDFNIITEPADKYFTRLIINKLS